MAVALLLTFAAGVVDIVGFLTFYSTFTAHMTGVTVHMGQYLVSHRGFDVRVLGGVLIAFVAGSILGRSMVELALYRNLRSAAGLALFVEAGLIFTVAALGKTGQGRVAMTLMLAAAMGLQTAALTRVGPLTVHTTFVTGMLNKLAQLLSHALFLTLGHIREHARKLNERPKVLREAAFIFSVWLVYFLGAAAGAWMNSHWAIRSLLLPGGIVAVTAVIDQAQPLSIAEEREQAGQ